ncbi:MAG: methyl-accepting chemotaxis protein [Defluviitaleaceae bacterium]|nr:methyl-accepting chemotaxis protein [Defluviitaleaceae bacterium]
MAILRNMKIGGKLALGFGLLLALTAIITIVGSSAVLSVDRGYSDAFDYPNARYVTLRLIDFDLMDTRRAVAMAVLSTGDQERIDLYVAQTNSSRSNINEHLAEFRQSLDDDPLLDSEVIALRHVQINQLENLVNRYFDVDRPQIITNSRAGMQAEATQGIHDSISGVFLEIYNTLYEMLGEMQAQMDSINEDITAESMQTLAMLIVLAVASVVLGVVVALVITKLITKPVSEVMGALEDVSQGNLAVNIRVNSNDETGALAKSAQAMISTLQRLISDMDHMASDHDKGEIDTFINAADFKGEFGTVADKINDMISSALATQDKVVGTFMEIADGNFVADMEKLPGKKAKLNDAVNDMKNRVGAVSGEINTLIDSAVKGELNFKIDETRYKGDWQKIMVGLNAIMEAVSEPLGAIEICMNEMKAGNFDLEAVDAIITSKGFHANLENYNGSFYTIVSAVNDVLTTTDSYIKELGDVLEKMAEGDLRVKINREYVGSYSAIKFSVNNIASSLNNTMSEISSASDQVLSGAKQISASAMDLATGASQQASSVEELNASIDMINQQTKDNADNADEANRLSKSSSDNAREGNEAMKKLLEAMIQIEDSSKNVSSVNKVIQDIAFQTNLLALNAAVEAARAGEHGKGFAVVAEEVRSLAARSQESSTETTGLINDSLEYVQTGSGIAQSTADSLDLIVAGADEVLQVINKISSASKEQAEAVNQVSIGLGQISTVVQNNSAVSEETASASEELNSQAELLQQLVSYFKL